MITLSYFKANETKQLLSAFTGGGELIDFLLEIKRKNTVFLLGIEKKDDNKALVMDEVFISESLSSIMYFIECNTKKYENDEVDIFLQEYLSYEEAYKVALSMKETSALCYEPDRVN